MKILTPITGFLLLGVALSSCVKDTTVQPKRKYLTSITINDIQWLDGSSSWDNNGTDPDIYMIYGPSGAMTHSTQEVDNVKQSDFPMSFTLPQRVELTDQEWTFQMFDADDFSADQLMAHWVFNPASQSQNPIRLTGSGSTTWDIEFHYVEE